MSTSRISGSETGRTIVADWETMVVVGQIARAHGIRGQVVVNPETDFSDIRFQEGAVLVARVGDDTREVRIAGVRFIAGRPVIALDGVVTVDAAKSLAGVELRVPETALSDLSPGTFYKHDLVGCVVTTVEGACVGRVTEIQGAVGAQRLIVRDGGSEIDVPLVEEICVSVDPVNGSIVVDPPKGLLELNRTG